MKDWSEYSKSKINSGSSENNKPKVFEYILIKLTDNFLAVAVFVLCLVFGYIGLFTNISESNIPWALHASELCLGVFLGLLAKKK
jgi:hypothetical protein